jgi:hypothetical protein
MPTLNVTSFYLNRLYQLFTLESSKSDEIWDSHRVQYKELVVCNVTPCSLI